MSTEEFESRWEMIKSQIDDLLSDEYPMEKFGSEQAKYARSLIIGMTTTNVGNLIHQSSCEIDCIVGRCSRGEM